ncbi:glycosyltransferase [Gordonia sp. ABSL1-1]|uniref:glycosyltransferase family 2 protein n=1 Tax=Gordonia sp. ABSL1-1 TaxID=3053923 RepID=UPI0025729E84|nr:glycosyltransferase [Gordonia sp. ABSL1-1]MDL9936071.1 glycosyltransferase [Gordonia sp. ABSL1-1]
MSSGTLGGLDVTVIICAYTHERWDDVCSAITSVVRQSCPVAHLVVVVDHNPDLAADLADYVARCGYAGGVSVIPSAGPRGLSGARNTGVDFAGTEIVAFLDDDAVAEPDWIAALVGAYTSASVRGVGGHVRAIWPEPQRPGWFPAEFDWVVGCSYVGGPDHATEIRNPIGANMSLRRADIVDAGGFHTGLGRVGKIPLGCEETELCIRIRRAGVDARIRYEPAARVGHRVSAERVAVGYFLRRCRAEGLSKAAVAGLVGSGDGLRSERVYSTRVLPLGLARRLVGVVRPGVGLQARRDLLAQAALLGGGLLVTTYGYARGRLARAEIPVRVARTATLPVRPVVPTFDATAEGTIGVSGGGDR